MPDWSSYFTRMEERPVSIAVDLSLRERAPMAGKPSTYTIAVALRRPDEQGLTVPDEYRALQAIEEELASALERRGLVEAGRVTGHGMRTFHYYGPAGADVTDTVAAVMNDHSEYSYRALQAADPAWALYTEYLYPDSNQLAFANDMKAMQALMQAGDNLDRPHRIEHTIGFDDPQKRDAFVRAMGHNGYELEIDPRLLAVRCVRHDAIDPFKIADTRVRLTTLAQEFGGTYGGWSTAVLP